jgi:hypothetical protein
MNGGDDVSDKYDITIATDNDSLIITKKTLGHNLAVVDTIYNGTTAARYTGGLTGIVTNDVDNSVIDKVSLASDFGVAFADDHAGVNKPIVISGWTLVGKDSANYTLPDAPSLTATIARKPVTVLVTFDKDTTYIGAPIELPPTVTYENGTVTIPPEEYSTTYTDNINAGIATATVTGKTDGNYVFTENETRTGTFTLAQATLTLTLEDNTTAVYQMGAAVDIDRKYLTIKGLYGNDNVDGDITYTYQKEGSDIIANHAADLGRYIVKAYFAKGSYLFAKNNNYKPAESNTVNFEVVLLPPEIYRLFVNEREIVPLTAYPHADLPCGSMEAVTVTVHVPGYVTLSYALPQQGTEETQVYAPANLTSYPATAEVTLPQMEMSLPGMLHIRLTVRSAGNRDSVYLLKVEKRFPFDDLVATRWNNTLTILHSAGGMDFDRFQLYRASDGGAFEPLLSDGAAGAITGFADVHHRSYTAGNDGTPLNAGDCYYAAVITLDGDTIRSCEHYPGLSAANAVAYPNPAGRRATLSVEIDAADASFTGASIYVYSPTGTLVGVVPVTGAITTLRAPDTAGMYLFILRTKDGFRKELKVIVE